MREHGQGMAYVVQCVASGLDLNCARALRDQLVSKAPRDVYVAYGATVTTCHCQLREDVLEVEVLSFSEWVKMRGLRPARRVLRGFWSTNYRKVNIYRRMEEITFPLPINLGPWAMCWWCRG